MKDVAAKLGIPLVLVGLAWWILRPRSPRREFVHGMRAPDPTVHRVTPHKRFGHFQGSRTLH